MKTNLEHELKEIKKIKKKNTETRGRIQHGAWELSEEGATI